MTVPETIEAEYQIIQAEVIVKKQKKIKIRTLAVCLVLSASVLLSACGRTTGESAGTKGIRELSAAAGYLASRVDRSDGFIAAELDNGEDNAFIYDNALAVVVLCEVGGQSYAEKIADAVVFAQTHDRSFNDGRLRNAYNSGNPKSDAGRSLVGGKVTVGLPGFWSDGKWQEDFYNVSTSTGNMAWVIIALCRAAEGAEDVKKVEYITAAERAADFVLTLKSPEGGFTAGYDGWDDTQTKATYISTEHNIDLICAFRDIADLTGNSEKSKEYTDASEYAKRFVLSMYDAEKGCVYAGTENDGITVSKNILPIDTNTLTILALGSDFPGRYKAVSVVEELISVGDGFDFGSGDLDGIWNEGTAQMALCYKELGNTAKYNTVIKYLKSQYGSDGSVPAADRDGVSTGFALSGTDTLWEYNNDRSIAATCWCAMAVLGFNPFSR